MLAWLVLILCLAVGPARAASITYEHGKRLDAIGIVGEIEKGDSTQFQLVADSIPQGRKAVVVLKSPGGLITEAIVIGDAIRSRQFATLVDDNTTCASACGLVWLAGTPRFVSPSARIGFHAAYTGEGDYAQENGSGNALVGAYLNRLGLPYRAVTYLTSAPPQGMEWLHPDTARSLGIDAEVLPEQPAQPKPPAAPQPAAIPEREGRQFVMSYFADWSRNGADVSDMARYYGEEVNFYGSTEPRAKIMVEKQKFAERWPVRDYHVPPATLNIACSNTCKVEGEVAWDVSSPTRNAHSTGTATFIFQIARSTSGSGWIIVAEDGKVLERRSDAEASAPSPAASELTASLGQTLAATGPASGQTPEQQAASETPGFVAGRQARIDYEQWFNGLPASSYRDGAAFWAANRSVKPTPSCMLPGASRAWQQGCEAARAHLAISDIRRRAERNFWLGWNSL